MITRLRSGKLEVNSNFAQLNHPKVSSLYGCLSQGISSTDKNTNKIEDNLLDGFNNLLCSLLPGKMILTSIFEMG